jgi:hypothetical protein
MWLSILGTLEDPDPLTYKLTEIYTVAAINCRVYGSCFKLTSGVAWLLSCSDN